MNLRILLYIFGGSYEKIQNDVVDFAGFFNF